MDKLQCVEKDLDMISQEKLATTEQLQYEFIDNHINFISSLFQNSKLSDVMIKLKDGLNIYGHKFVWCAQSSFWADIEMNNIDSIDLSGFRFEVSYALVKWLYTDEIEINSLDVWKDLALAAETTKINVLLRRCKAALQQYDERVEIQKELLPSVSVDDEKVHQTEKLVDIQEGSQSPIAQDELSDSNDSHVHTEESTIESEDKVKPRTYNKKGIKVKIKCKSPINVSRSKKYTCDKCGKILSSAYALNYHQKTHLQEKAHVCPICGKGCLTLFHYKQHMVTHNNFKPFSCPECDRSFSRRDTLQSHMKRHITGKNHICYECGRVYFNLTDLNKHIRIHHTRDREFPCQVCSKIFYCNSSLTQHMISHTEGSCYVCDICGKEMKRKKSLQMHMNKHKNKPFKCGKCAKDFFSQKACDKHMKIHHWNKILTCKQCEATFETREDFHNHRQLEHKDYSCSICAKHLTDAAAFDQHLKKSHNIPCDKCSRTFLSVSHLKLHEKKCLLDTLDISPENQQICANCGKSFRTYVGLKNHQRVCKPATIQNEEFSILLRTVEQEYIIN